ncbi:carbohydrate ABC transporter permease [Sinorhizobium meliloti WSM1022]|jgi:ABC-type glycerol-3-phosphate transport system permease component|uniref:carbohydrate ABC transporter permease n=1 Tax=Rhizobium meliloti TaxID=382 RepID=UPI0003FFD1CD|nr:carbohydrate ABC transporter permease [Sinorhizobium meliloti]ASQ03127.1 carbohydrate ABC transporter permease [Sinorhizobium meliloti]MCO6422069.1 carbohydrate ABC transporter permease [Sinorhizobium meliloti]MDW9407481.1 ABC transporter permease subunit [Sinorhizobium meliloti]MDW9418349.1 ABC transporter permease subunit [Sinorhizobium meliloti]MDW9442291.1 ABC transporter permease subunit [Sinorhizobium meliloti]
MLQRESSFAKEALRYGLIVLVLGFIVFPIAWMIITSFKPADAVMVSPPRFLFTPTLENYTHAIYDKNFLFYIKNTLFISVASTVIVVVTGSLAAYSFARYNVGDGHLLFFILSTKMFPAIAVILPYFLIFRDVGKTGIGRFFGIGLDQPGALIISYTVFNLPFAIWLLVSFFQDIPRELEHSARLDGLSRLKVLAKVVCPLAAPGIAVTGVFTLIFSWNEFLFAYILTRKAASTVTVGVESFFTLQGILWGPVAAAATISVLPMLVFVLAMQRYMVRGLTFGAVRG